MNKRTTRTKHQMPNKRFPAMKWMRNNVMSLWPTSLCLACFLLANTAKAETPTFTLEIRDHLFFPSTLVIPANTKVKLIVKNTDATPEEFESYELNREKVIMGGAKAIIFIGPLPVGDYPFFGEFNPKTAQGVIKVEP